MTRDEDTEPPAGLVCVTSSFAMLKQHPACHSTWKK